MTMSTISIPLLDLQVLKLADHALGALDAYRDVLPKTTPHTAQDVASAGRRWLTAMLSLDEIDAIAGFKASPHEALLLTGLPLGTDVETPTTGFLANDECVLDFDLLHFGMLSLMGVEPYAVDYENNGKLVRNVVPVASASGMASSWGADIDFSWHTDNPNWPFSEGVQDMVGCIPRFLAFTAVRNLEEASTDIAPVSEILARLPDWVVSELQRPAYAFGAPPSNDDLEGDTRILPIVEVTGSRPYLRFDGGIVTALDPRGARALAMLRDCLGDIKGTEVVLQPGDFFIFKNECVVHRRRAFRPFLNGHARWLRRVYGY